MPILKKIAHKINTAALAMENFNAFRKGVPVYDLERYQGPWIQNIGIDLVLDIGASKGTFSLLFRHLLPAAKIVAFEPIPRCYAVLCETMKDDPDFIAYQCALGEVDAPRTFQENEFSQSSSLLELAEAHKAAYPFARKTKNIEVSVRRLDSLADELPPFSKALLKIDTQGAEREVMIGAHHFLKKCSIVIVELSFQVLYAGQPLFDEMYTLLSEQGFSFNGVVDYTRDTRTGAPLQVDAVFMNRTL